jgi:hypothetical protein
MGSYGNSLDYYNVHNTNYPRGLNYVSRPPPIDPAPAYAFESHCRPSGKCYARTKESLEKENYKNKNDSDSDSDNESDSIKFKIPKMYLYIFIFIIIQILVAFLINMYMVPNIYVKQLSYI